VSQVDLVIAGEAQIRHGVVSSRELERAGVTRQAIRRRVLDGRLAEQHRGVYAVGAWGLGLRGRWRAAVLAMGPGALLSHRDAAMLWDIARTNRRAVDVTVNGPRPCRTSGITVHRSSILQADDRAELDSIPVTAIPRTLLDLAAVAPSELRRAYEDAERLRLLDMRMLWALAERSNGHRGVGRLRRLLSYDPSQAAQADTPLERLFFDLCREEGIPQPEPQVPIGSYRVDALYVEQRLVIELDSYGFHSHRSAFEYDRKKIAELRLAGYDVLPLTHRQLTREREWVAATLRELHRPGRLKNPPHPRGR